jgi:TPR repeat protein
VRALSIFAALGLVVGCGGTKPRLAAPSTLEAAISTCRSDIDRCSTRCHDDVQEACRAQIVLIAEDDAAMKRWLLGRNLRVVDLKLHEIVVKATTMCSEGFERGCHAKVFFESKLKERQGDTFCEQGKTYPEKEEECCSKGYEPHCIARGVAASDPQEKVKYLRPACENGNDFACSTLIDALDELDPADEKVILHRRKQCDAGAPEACFILGMKYMDGVGVDRDPEKGLALIEPTCAKVGRGRRTACFKLVGAALREKEGNSYEVRELFEAACKARDGKDACLDYGSACAGPLLMKGAQARDVASCYEPSCKEERSPQGCFEQAELLLLEPTKEDLKAAVFALNPACEAKIPTACEKADKATEKYVGIVKSELPSLFAKCSNNKSYIGRWRASAIQAARRGDLAAADEAKNKILAIEPEWNATLEALREAADLVTDDQAEFVAFMKRVERECNCRSTPAGRCR